MENAQENLNYDNVEETQDPEAQKIIDELNGELPEDEEEVELPSDDTNQEDTSNEEQEEKKLYAGKYKTVDDLKNGVKNLNKDISDTILNGMTEESLEQYYKELQADFSKDRKHKIATEETTNKEVTKEDKPKEAGAIPQELWNELGQTFAEKGGITDEQYDKLAELGIPEAIVDNYLDGLNAKANEVRREIYEVTGGEEKAKEIKAWADENIDEEYINYVNGLSGKSLINAIKGIKAQYDLATNQTKRVVGRSNSSKSSGSYKSMDEYMKDVSDKRYNTDETFRRAVDKKLANSKL